MANFANPDLDAYMAEMGNIKKAKEIIEQFDFRTLDLSEAGILRRTYNQESGWSFQDAQAELETLPPKFQELIELMARGMRASKEFQSNDKTAYFDQFLSGEKAPPQDFHIDGITTVHISVSGAGLECEARVKRYETEDFQVQLGSLTMFNGDFSHKGPGGHASLNIQTAKSPERNKREHQLQMQSI